MFGYYTLMPPRRVADVYILKITQETETKKQVSKANNYIMIQSNGKPIKVIYNGVFIRR